MSSATPIPPGVNVHASKQPQLYAALLITYILGVIAVALRFWARRLMKQRVLLDDWLIAAALSVATGKFADELVWLHQGGGRRFQVLGDDSETRFYKNLFENEILYVLVICLVKFSILALYSRLFATSIRMSCYIIAGVLTCWGLAVILVTIFQCIPIHAFWDREISARCTVNGNTFCISQAIPNILTDATILLLPVPYLWRLQTTRSQKIALIGTFMLGGLVTIVSIVRLKSLISFDYKSPDLNYSIANLTIVTNTECNIAIVSACLPSLRPILSLVMNGDPNPSASKGYASGRAWVENQPSAVTEVLGEASCETKFRHKLMTLSDETSGISGIGPSHATVIAAESEILGGKTWSRNH